MATTGSPNIAEWYNPRPGCISCHGVGPPASAFWQSACGPGGQSGRGSAFLVVGLADGGRRSIRVACTDLAVAIIRPLLPPPEVCRIRARIEHVFGAQETAPGGRLVRTIGIVRALRSACRTSFTTSVRWFRSNGWPPPDGRRLTSATDQPPGRWHKFCISWKSRIRPSAAHAALEIGINRSPYGNQHIAKYHPNG